MSGFWNQVWRSQPSPASQQAAESEAAEPPEALEEDRERAPVVDAWTSEVAAESPQPGAGAEDDASWQDAGTEEAPDAQADLTEEGDDEPVEDLQRPAPPLSRSAAPPDTLLPARRPLGWTGRRQKRALVKPDEARKALLPQERLLILDTWQRSGLPAGDFAPLVGISKHTLYLWKKRFVEDGPAGLAEQRRGAKQGSKLTEVVRRTIVMLKQAHPDWGCQRISQELQRGPAMGASAGAVRRVLHEAGYELEERVTRPHPDKVRRFERARPNQLWQTDLFTFMLKRQNRRLHLVGFLDDHSRFVVGYGLHASASGALVLEVLRAAIASYGVPQEILTDNGPQYVTWRGKSQFSRELEQQGIRQVVSRPKHPQTLGKIERFWGTLWRECLERAVFLDLEDARRRIGLFIDHYNFQRPHQSLAGAAPADRFFQAAPTVLQTLRQRVAGNALEQARQGTPRPPFYVTGQVAGQPFSVHAEGERVFLTRAGQPRQEVELAAPEHHPEANSPPAPLCPHGAPASQEEAPERAPGVAWPEAAPPLAGASTSAEEDAWRAQDEEGAP